MTVATRRQDRLRLVPCYFIEIYVFSTTLALCSLSHVAEKDDDYYSVEIRLAS